MQLIREINFASLDVLGGATFSPFLGGLGATAPFAFY